MKHLLKTATIRMLQDETYVLDVTETDRVMGKTYPVYSGSGGLTSIIKRAREELATEPVKKTLGGPDKFEEGS